MSTEVLAQDARRQLVSFFLADEEYAVDIAHVQEIVRMVEITRVPRAPGFVEGVINLRGKIVPVIDLRRRFELPVGEHSRRTRIIIVTVDARTVGLIVDGVSEVLRLPSAAIDPAPELVTTGLDAGFIAGVGKLNGRLLILLALEKILKPEERAALAAM